MATMGVDGMFVDANILIYAGVRKSPLHAAAVTKLVALRKDGVDLWISRQILREYMAAMTRPQANSPPFPAVTVVADVTAFQRDFQIAEDNAAITAHLMRLLVKVPMGGKQVHDANIVATMLEYNIPKLLTHNTSDFARFTSFITVEPLVP
jgi:predicted nucleic acid-binding protein